LLFVDEIGRRVSRQSGRYHARVETNVAWKALTDFDGVVDDDNDQHNICNVICNVTKLER